MNEPVEPLSNAAEPPVVYTIAGSDSSGGAGIQADLATFNNFGVHGCPVITALTSQNRNGVHQVAPTSVDYLRRELQVLAEHLPPAAIKLGMLVNQEIVGEVNAFLKGYRGPVVCDPVMSASAGGALLDDSGRRALLSLLPQCTLLRPNTDEAGHLTGVRVNSFADMELAAAKLLDLGCSAVLISGGHLPDEGCYCYDYFATSGLSFWLRGERITTRHTHGTGCTLSSGIAAALALGYEPEDAVVLGKMAVTRGLRSAVGMGGGPGCVAHPGWPDALEDLPVILPGSPEAFKQPQFPGCDSEKLGLYPVVDSVGWLAKLLAEGIGTIQLRIKAMPETELRQAIVQAVNLQHHYNARLFINDHWRLAIEYRAYGVHLGQEDLATADVQAIARAGLRLGLSNHAWHEIARSHALAPSYMALGPIFHTTTKVMRFAPQGIAQLQQWVDLLQPRYPLTAIGGIDLARAAPVAATGVGSIAVVRAITEADDYRRAVLELNEQLAGVSPGEQPQWEA